MWAFRQVFAGRGDLAAYVTAGEQRIKGILKPITTNEFIVYLERRQWIIDVVQRDGQDDHIDWGVLHDRLPSSYRAEIQSVDALLESLRLFVWLHHATGYDGLRIDFTPKKTAGKKGTIASAPTPAGTKPPPGTVKTGKTTERQRPTGSRKYRHEDRSLDLYLSEIGQTPLLSSDEEYVLAERIKQGDTSALERLTKANLRFVVSVAKQYQNQGLSLADLINEGNIGLIKAAKRFDETRGFKFISYAVWWIRQAILQALAEQSRIVRIPLNRVGVLHKIGKTATALEQVYARDPSYQEIADELKITPAEVEDTLKISNLHLSLDAPLLTAGAETTTLIDYLEDKKSTLPDEALYISALREEIERALETLNPREAEVIGLYFGLTVDKALTLEQIGARFNLTRERVRQIKEKAIRRMQHASRARALRPFLDHE